MKEIKLEAIMDPYVNQSLSESDEEYFRIDYGILELTKNAKKRIKSIFKATRKLQEKSDNNYIKSSILLNNLQPTLFKEVNGEKKEIYTENFDEMHLICTGDSIYFNIKYKYSYIYYELSCDELDYKNFMSKKK